MSFSEPAFAYYPQHADIHKPTAFQQQLQSAIVWSPSSVGGETQFFHPHFHIQPQHQQQHQQRGRPFCCTVPHCGRSFHRRFTLHEHMKTHSGEKPHKCPIENCGKRFSTSGNLARHKRLHSLSQYKCPEEGCERVFTKPEKLARHAKTHLGATTHACTVPGCTKSFSTVGNLTRHTKTRHPELIPAKPVIALSLTTHSPVSSKTAATARSLIQAQQSPTSPEPLLASGLPLAYHHHQNRHSHLIQIPVSQTRPAGTATISDNELMEVLGLLFVDGASSIDPCHSSSYPALASGDTRGEYIAGV